MIRYRRLLFGAVGIVAVGLGVGLILAPGLVAVGPINILSRALDTVGPANVLLVTGVGLVGYLAVGLRSPPATNEPSPFDSPAEAPEAHTSELAGGELEELFQSAIADGGESLEQARARLRRTATAVYADRMECSTEEARAAIERGEWCQDSLAAAVLSDRQSAPIGAQLRLFVLPDSERRRRIERSLAAIERLEEL